MSPESQENPKKKVCEALSNSRRMFSGSYHRNKLRSQPSDLFLLVLLTTVWVTHISPAQLLHHLLETSSLMRTKLPSPN